MYFLNIKFPFTVLFLSKIPFKVTDIYIYIYKSKKNVVKLYSLLKLTLSLYIIKLFLLKIQPDQF